MSEPRSPKKCALEALGLFLLLAARACAFGARYWPQLDDYIQMHNYRVGFTFSQLQETVGVLSSRPLAGLADYFLWTPLFEHLIWVVFLMSALYALTAVLLREVLRRYFKVGPVFLVVLALLPLGVEGTYWLSAATRIVPGLFFAALAAWTFTRWLDNGKLLWLLLYLPLQLLPFGFYEQAGIFSVTLTVAVAYLERTCRQNDAQERRKRRKHVRRRGLWSLWSAAAMGIYLAVTSYFSNGGVYGSRAELVLPNSIRYWTEFLPQVLKQFKEVFLTANFYTLVKGFVRGVRLIFSGKLALWALLVAALSVALWLFLRRERAEEGARAPFRKALLMGLVLAVAPLTIFLVLDNPWFSLRGAVASLPGLALMADTLVEALRHRLPSNVDGPALLAAALALVFCVAGASEVGDYRDTHQNDVQIGQAVLTALQKDHPDPAKIYGQTVGVLGVEASYLPNQNYFYHEHIHGCTESAWAFNGLLGTLAGWELPSVTPLPSDPMYRKWNQEANRPERFEWLYYCDGRDVIPVTLHTTGEHAFDVLDANGALVGFVWEENDVGYFREIKR